MAIIARLFRMNTYAESRYRLIIEIQHYATDAELYH